MCLGVPGKVVTPPQGEREFATAFVEFEGLRRKVAMACVPDARLDDFVIVHAGIAIARIDPAEAERALRLLRALGEDEGWSDGGLHEAR